MQPKKISRSSLVLDPEFHEAMAVIKDRVGVPYTKQVHVGLVQFFKEHKQVLTEAGITIKGVN